MLKANCKHCTRPITYQQGDNGMWYEATVDVQLGSQYCWMDPVGGSQLHQPNEDTIVDDSKLPEEPKDPGDELLIAIGTILPPDVNERAFDELMYTCQERNLLECGQVSVSDAKKIFQLMILANGFRNGKCPDKFRM